MDSQEAATADRRGTGVVNPTNSEEAAKMPSDATTTKAAEPASKTPEHKDANTKTTKVKGQKKRTKSKAKKTKKTPVVEENSSDSSSDDANSSTPSSDSDDSDDSESEVETKKKKSSSKKPSESHKSKKKAKSKKTKRSTKTQIAATDSSDDETDLSDNSDSNSDSDEDGDDEDEGELSKEELLQSLQVAQLQLQQLQQAQLQQAQQQRAVNPFSFNNASSSYLDALQWGAAAGLNTQRGRGRGRRGNNQLGRGLGLDELRLDGRGNKRKQKSKSKSKSKSQSPGARLEFKRVDQVWDNSIHNYKLQDTAETSTDSQYDEYLFHVRRTFDWEGKFKFTYVDIKSKILRECLQDVIGNIKGVSLVEETPKLDPNLLFLYLEDFRKHMKHLKKVKASGSTKKEKKKDQKRNETKRQQLKVLVKFIDHDYASVKKSLYPMLENGLITFDLLWALWKPNTLAYTSTYGSHDEPRVFKVEMTEKHYTIMKGDYYWIEGKYFEYDGKQFGYGTMSEEIGDFQGARKITSLGCYPLKYHKNEAKIRADLIERGKKFVRLSGVHYKNHQGMAYFKKKKAIVKVNINGRIMVDPAIHRRINPNYTISLVRPKDHDVLSDGDDSDDDSDGYCCATESEDGGGNESLESADKKPKYVTKVYRDRKGDLHTVRVSKDDLDDEQSGEKLDQVPVKKDTKGDGEGSAETKVGTKEGEGEDEDEEDDEKALPEYSDEEYLIASPVVLGFAFSEKLWLEFTVSGVKEIQWNEKAYDSLVLEPKTKDIIKALVESHKYHAAESIDDVIQGKGKGLVSVLHGPPGTGKTLTAEGISELLKCPLYMASAGELGTDSRFLEGELQKILDICHAWGAILLLDEADVFLEKRNMTDIHRNALVSIFLRQLEYFQGILFLTTNRVETFDDAFQSRIHIALRYDNLDFKARKAIFKIFVERVRVLENIDLMPFTEQDFSDLAKNELNGRQIKNTVRTAQALAVNQKQPLSMRHIRQVLDVQNKFDRDLKGGQGYQEALRSYF